MIAVRALMNPAAQAAQAELRLGLLRTNRGVRVYVRRRVGLVQKPIELLAVMHTRVGHVVLPDQLVLGIRIHVVLVAVEALAVLLGPARILVFLPVLGRVLLPRPRRLASLHVVILVAAIARLRQVLTDFCQQLSWAVGLWDKIITAGRSGLFLVATQGVRGNSDDRYRG